MRRRLLILFCLSVLGAAGAPAQDEPRSSEDPEGLAAAGGEALDAEEDVEAAVPDATVLPEEPVSARDELFLAIELRDVEAARRILRGGAEAEISAGDPSPLATAALHDDLAMVTLLLDFGGDPSATADSPLEEAVRNENVGVVQLLLQAGARVPAGEPGQELFRLAQRGLRARELCKRLVDHDADPDLCLAAAVEEAHIELIETCLELGGDVGALPEGLNILGVALRSGEPGIVTRVLGEGLADRVVAGALGDAVVAGDLDVVRLAVTSGGKPSFAHLEAAVESGRSDISLFLLDQSAPDDPAVLQGGDAASLIQRAEDLRLDEVAAALRRKQGRSIWSLERVLPVALGGLLAIGLLALLARNLGRARRAGGRSSKPAPAVRPPAVASRPEPPRPPPTPAPPTPARTAPEAAPRIPIPAVAAPEVPRPEAVRAPAAGTRPIAARREPLAGDAETAWEMVPEPADEGPVAEDSPIAVASDEAAVAPRMPEVNLSRSAETVFQAARRAASGEAVRPDAPDRRQIVLVTPSRAAMLHSCPAADSLAPAELAAAERTVPSATPKNVAAIAYNDLDAVSDEISSAIPFFDLLTHLGALGHAVWIFEGHVSAMAAGCQEADVLIVDDGMMRHLPGNWRSVAMREMRGSDIFLFERRTGMLRRLG